MQRESIANHSKAYVFIIIEKRLRSRDGWDTPFDRYSRCVASYKTEYAYGKLYLCDRNNQE